MASFDEQMASIPQRVASGAARLPEAAPPDPRQKLTTLKQAAAASLAELMAAHKNRAEVPHPALAAARSLAEQTLARQGAPSLLLPPPALAELMAARNHRVVVPDPALAAARSLAEQTVARQEQLKALRKQSRDLQSQLQQARSIKLHKESEHSRITELISCVTATNEKLKMSLMELCNTRDAYAALSDQFQDLEIWETKTNEAATLGNFEALFSWFNKFLGLNVVIGEEGLKFVFNKIHPQCPEKEYSFCIKIDDDNTYNLVQCDRPIEDFEELLKDLNLSGDLLKFLKVAREKFQASSMNGNLTLSSGSCPDVPSVPLSLPTTTAVNNTSEDVPNRSNSQSKSKRLPAKRRGTILSPGSVRRSPRFQVPSTGKLKPGRTDSS